MKRALVADDTKNIRLMLSKYLELEGYQVFCAENGRQALSLLLETNFDLVLLDIKMPELSGTEVLRQLQQAGKKSTVIVMTAYGTIKNAVETTNLGAVAYLQKPFTTEKLKKLLSSLEEETIIGELEDRLHVLSQMIEHGDCEKAIKRLKALLKDYSLNEQVYLLLAKGYEGLGLFDTAQTYRALAKTLAHANR